jgi:putative sterol carrier protein
MAQIETLDDLFKAYREYFDPDAAEGVYGTVQLDLKDGGQRRKIYMVIEDQSIDIQEGVHDDPSITVKTSAEHWLRVSRGEENPMTLLMRDEMSIEGPMAMATQFQSLFKMP